MCLRTTWQQEAGPHKCLATGKLQRFCSSGQVVHGWQSGYQHKRMPLLDIKT